jgi:hypothetical protein
MALSAVVARPYSAQSLSASAAASRRSVGAFNGLSAGTRKDHYDEDDEQRRHRDHEYDRISDDLGECR